MWSSTATNTSASRWTHHEFIESGTISNPLRATMEKGEEAFRRYAEHCARGIMELEKVPVEVRSRDFVDRAL